MKTSNGCDGSVGESWCILYPIEEVVGMTLTYREATLTPPAVFIGTDGGGEAYLIDYGTPVPTLFRTYQQGVCASRGPGAEKALLWDQG